MKIVDDLGREYKSKMSAASVADCDQRQFWLEEPLHTPVSVTTEIHRFRNEYRQGIHRCGHHNTVLNAHPDTEHFPHGVCYDCFPEERPTTVRALPKSPPDGWVTEKGWYGLLCFNSLDGALQRRLVYYGNIPLGHATDGRCHNPAEVEITTVHDAMPGPRFLCITCAIEYLTEMKATLEADDD